MGSGERCPNTIRSGAIQSNKTKRPESSGSPLILFNKAAGPLLLQLRLLNTHTHTCPARLHVAHTGAHTPLTPLIAWQPPLMDASKWNGQIIQCLNALGSISSLPNLPSLLPRILPSSASRSQHFNPLLSSGRHATTGPSPP